MAKPRSRRHRAQPAGKRLASEPRPADDHSPAGAAPEEVQMFRAAVRDVIPLQHTPRVAASNPPRAHRRGSAARAVPRTAALDLVSTQELLAEVVPGEDAPTGADPLSFGRPGVRAQTLRRLRRGLYPIEDELDLHGLSQAAARDSLAEFLAYNRDAGRRCIRIVHGKGYRSGARGPILKVAVDTWLRRHPDVMAFTSARPIDGGTGAVYVLLRA
jgi:DNA-nicking Smr family endonuclease